MSTKTYVATIGLEVHAELNTKSKMFCGCANDPHHGEPNAHTCPICLAHPGTLPVPNEEAVRMVLMFGQAVGATRATYSEFDRKNYFYPDIPKAYQISQYAFPFLTGGSLKGVALTRVHLEEDTARSQHEHGDSSLVDFNRAGVPLMELVTEPVIHDAETAGAFARELQLMLRTLGISNAQMEQGEMRVEANISVSPTGELGTKVEVKNLNSFRSVESAIAYEINRQITLLEDGGAVVQETRGWDEVKLRTFVQRSKETAKDYRYFPDPDIPKISVEENTTFSVSRIADIMPDLPEKKRKKYEDIGLPSNQIELLISDQRLDGLFAILATSSVIATQFDALKLAANYLTSDTRALLEQGKELKLSADNFAALINLVSRGLINSRVAKDLLVEVIETNVDPEALARERGLLQSSDPTALLPIVAEILADNPTVVADFKAGKESVLQFLVGQGMKKSRGTANPGVLAELIRTAIASS